MNKIHYGSEPQDITDAINERLSAETDLDFKLERSEPIKGVDLFGTLGGREVRIEIRHEPGTPPYSESFWIYDRATNETLGRGNGADTLYSAMGIYHWNVIPGQINDLD